MIFRTALLALLVGSIVAAPLTKARATTVMKALTEPESGVSIEVISWLDSCPASGMVPLRIRIRNGDARSHTWNFTARSNSYNSAGMESRISVRVEAKQEGLADFYVPVETFGKSTYFYGNVNIAAEGFGLESSSVGNLGSAGVNSPRTDYVAMGSNLSPRYWSSLRDEIQRSNAKPPKSPSRPGAPPTTTIVASSSSSPSNLHGSTVDMRQAPTDWRGYMGISQLWLDDAEWRDLGGAVKVAVWDWVALGGKVFVVHKSDPNASGSGNRLRPPDALGTLSHGAGSFTALVLPSASGDRKTADAQMAEMVLDEKQISLPNALDEFGVRWGFRHSVGTLGLNAPLILGFIIVFGITVGPLNLFWFAGPSRRHRLFWTIPLISLAGGVLLFVLVLIQDGTGGAGARSTLALMQPEQKRLAIIQQQVSKSGLLLRRSFPAREPMAVTPLSQQYSSNRYGNREAGSYLIENGGFSGDWFQSRSIESQLVQAVRPSRAALEWIAPEAGQLAPSVISSLEVPLQKVWMVGEDKKVWTTTDVGTGEKKQLREAKASEFTQWMINQAGAKGGLIGEFLNAQREPMPGWAFASSAEGASLMISTLDSIRWGQNEVILMGPYLKQGVAP